MKRLVMRLLVVLCLISVSVAFSEGNIPEEWNLIFETEDEITAAKQACLMFDSLGEWEKADVQTVGLSVLDEQTENARITLLLYVSHSVYDTSSGTPDQIAGSLHTAKIVFEKQENGYRLLTYMVPEDGSSYSSSMKKMLGKELAKQVMSGEADSYEEAAVADADAEAANYILHLSDDTVTGTWIEPMETGSNSNAKRVVRDSFPGSCPDFIGKTVWQQVGKLYVLSVEGEQTYSGTITLEIYDESGSRVSYVKVIAEGKKLNVLEGELPDIYE